MTREPLNLEALRRREVQMMGAAISTRSWHDMENAYNQLRDKIDAELTRLHLATKDAVDPQSREQAFDGEGAIAALELARPIVEGDYHDAKDHCDADWEGMSKTTLDAIDAALSSAKRGEEG